MSSIIRHAHAQLFATSFTWLRSSGSIFLRAVLSMPWVSFQPFSPPPTTTPSPYGSFTTDIFQCDAYLFVSFFCGGLWLGCAVMPAMGRYSFYHLAAKSESPWILQALILHLAMQLLTKSFSKLEVKCIKWNPIISGQPFHWDLYKLI